MDLRFGIDGLALANDYVGLYEEWRMAASIDSVPTCQEPLAPGSSRYGIWSVPGSGRRMTSPGRRGTVVP
jgi:hypothetical protein